jgi:AcrR family transcriptional regulator
MSTASIEKSAIKQTTPQKPARDRIFNSAKELFYLQGIRAVGVESIAEHAGTTKMSLYRNFQSKDELVAECLRDHKREFWAWWDSVIEPLAGDPKAQLLALVDAFVTCECDEHSRGCPLANAIVELHEPQHPGRAVIRDHKNEMRSRLRGLCHAMGAADADRLGDSLMLLIEGAYVCQLVFRGGDGPTSTLPDAVRTLLDCQLEIKGDGAP